MAEGRLQNILKNYENDKWRIMKTDDKMLIWTNVIFLKIFLFFFFNNLAKPPMGASNVHMREKFEIKDDLSMLCEHG